MSTSLPDIPNFLPVEEYLNSPEITNEFPLYGIRFFLCLYIFIFSLIFFLHESIFKTGASNSMMMLQEDMKTLPFCKSCDCSNKHEHENGGIMIDGNDVSTTNMVALDDRAYEAHYR